MSDEIRPARLVWRRPDGHDLAFNLEPRALIVGRDEEADLRVDEPLVSRQHARLEPRDGGWLLTDLGSTNFTRVNGDVINERLLENGDQIRFARAQCTFELAPAVVRIEPPPPPADDPRDDTMVDAVSDPDLKPPAD